VSYEDLRDMAQPYSQVTSWVNTKPPMPIFNEKGVTIGYTPGEGYFKVTNNSGAKIIRQRLIRQSVNTAGFNSKLRPSPLPHNSFTYDKTQYRLAVGFLHSYTIPTGSITTQPGNSGYSNLQKVYSESQPGYNSVIDPGADWTSKLQGDASRKVLNNMKDQSFNAAQALAERKQTADLFAKTATRVAKAITSLRKGDMLGAARGLGVVPPKRAKRRFNKSFAKGQADAVGNAWLELQYGWKPLLSDVFGAAEHLAKSNNNAMRGKVHGRAQRQETVTTTTNRSVSPYKGYDKTVSTGTAKVSIRYTILFEVSSPTEQSLSKLGISNPLLLAWELLPYSFVADWFLPVGSWLGSLDATKGLTFKAGSYAYYRSWDESTSTEFSFGDPGYKSEGFEISGTRKVSVKRVPIAGFPSAPFPSFKNPLSTSHVASALALLLQLKR
jgi:hypothetical protein